MKSLLNPRRLLIRLAVAGAVLVVLIVSCSLIGSTRISVWEALTSSGTVNPDAEILFKARLPRVLLAAVVGAGLACAGTVFQALLRNPLADPYILGISSGAGLGTIIAVIAGFNWTIFGWSPLGIFAFAGSILTVALVWCIGNVTGKRNVTALLLAGVVVNAFFSAIIMFLTSVTGSHQLQTTVFWLMGNIRAESGPTVWGGAGFVTAAVVGMYYLGPSLNALSFDEEDAEHIGLNTGRIRNVSLVLASLVTAVSVSLSGLVGFVGLVVPHAVRLSFGADHRQLIPLSALVGASFVVVADTFARTIVAPAQLPVGVVTAIAGAPFFLVLLLRYLRDNYGAVR